jgi:hypothetical protein
MVGSSTHKWALASQFRRQAFGWRSALPIQRLKEAVTEIKRTVRTDPLLAADGAVLLLEKLSPALEQVDSSSGALGSVGQIKCVTDGASKYRANAPLQ